MRNILVSAVGGGVGQSVLKALDNSSYGIVGVDTDVLAAGLYTVSKAYQGYKATDPYFIDGLLDICRKEGCGLIFPGLEGELLPLSQNADRFRSEGIIPVVSSPEVIRICDDKLATQDFLKANGFPTLETKPLKEIESFQKPVILKPQRGGARSQHTFAAHSPEELNKYREFVDPDNCIAQEFVDGDEYTCGSVTLDSKCFGVIVMRRILRDGDTYKAFVEHPSPLETIVRNIVEALNPFGACNVQLRVKDGKPYVFEINARCSGTTAARALAGFNEPKMIADYLYNQIIPEYTIREISILRYWKELVVSNSRIDELRVKQFLSGDGSGL